MTMSENINPKATSVTKLDFFVKHNQITVDKWYNENDCFNIFNVAVAFANFITFCMLMI